MLYSDYRRLDFVLHFGCILSNLFINIIYTFYFLFVILVCLYFTFIYWSLIDYFFDVTKLWKWLCICLKPYTSVLYMFLMFFRMICLFSLISLLMIPGEFNAKSYFKLLRFISDLYKTCQMSTKPNLYADLLLFLVLDAYNTLEVKLKCKEFSVINKQYIKATQTIRETDKKWK